MPHIFQRPRWTLERVREEWREETEDFRLNGGNDEVAVQLVTAKADPRARKEFHANHKEAASPDTMQVRADQNADNAAMRIRQAEPGVQANKEEGAAPKTKQVKPAENGEEAAVQIRQLEPDTRKHGLEIQANSLKEAGTQTEQQDVAGVGGRAAGQGRRAEPDGHAGAEAKANDQQANNLKVAGTQTEQQGVAGADGQAAGQRWQAEPDGPAGAEVKASDQQAETWVENDFGHLAGSVFCLPMAPEQLPLLMALELPPTRNDLSAEPLVPPDRPHLLQRGALSERDLEWQAHRKARRQEQKERRRASEEARQARFAAREAAKRRGQEAGQASVKAWAMQAYRVDSF